MNVIYRGGIAELQGKSFEIPSDIALEKAGAWIEQQHEAEQAAAAATAAANAAREEDRQHRKQKRDADLAALKNKLTSLEQKLNGIARDEPDLLMLASTAASIASVIDSAHRLAAETTAINERLESNLEANKLAQTNASELAAQAEKINKETLLVLKNNQEISNKAFNSYGDRLNKFRASLTDLESDVRLMVANINESAETVRLAANITEEAVNIARAAAQEEVQTQHEMFISSINLMMAALGLDKAQVMQALNAASITKKPIITAQELAVAVNQHTTAVATMEDADKRIDIASATSTDSTMNF